MVEASGKLSCLIFFLPHFFLQFKKKWESKQKRVVLPRKHCQQKLCQNNTFFHQPPCCFGVFFWGGQEFSPMPRPKRNRDGEGASDFF